MEKIFRYIDYRHYLDDYYTFMKESVNFFSYRWFAQKAGISSSGLYQRVTKGERNLSSKTIEQFILGMELSEKEAVYFRTLVAFNQAKSAQEKQHNYTLMLSMADFIQEHQLAVDEYAYLSKWYLPVLREIVTTLKFGNNYSLLAKKVEPKITSREAKQGVELLLRLGFIELQDSGLYTQRDTAIVTGDNNSEMLGLACRSFNSTMMEHAQNSLQTQSVDKRFAAGITMGISESAYDAIIQEYEAFRERVVSLVDRETKTEKVCQMSFQLFPVSKDLHDQGEK